MKNSNNRIWTIYGWALAFECACGWGAFVMPGTVFLPQAGPLGTTLGLVFASVFIGLIGISLSYMVRRFPEETGIHAYIYKLLGSDHGFLSAWAVILAYLSILWANATAVILLIRYLAGGIFQRGFHYQVAGYDVYFGEILFTMGLIIISGLISISGNRIIKGVFVALALVHILIVICLFLCVLMFGKRTAPGSFSFASNDFSSFAQVFNITMLAPWMFVGFEAVTYVMNRDSKAPGRKGYIILAAILTGFVNYLLLSLIPVFSLPESYTKWFRYISDSGSAEGLPALPVFYSVYCAMGNAGLRLLSLAVLCSVLTSLIGLYRVTARMFASLSREGLLPVAVGRTDRHGQPVVAAILIMIVSAVIPFFGRTAIGWIVDVTTISATIVYIYVTIGSFRLSRSEGGKHRLIGVISIAGMLFAMTSFLFLLIPNIISENKLATESYFILAVWSVAGYVYYWFVLTRDEKQAYGNSTVTWMLQLFLVFFSTEMWIRQRSLDRIESLGESDKLFVSRIFSANAVVQMIVAVAVLLLMFSMFLTMLKRQRKADKKALESEARSRAKTSFLFNMSHDIRTPMNAILGFADLALLDTGNREKMNEYLGKIRSSGTHLLALINDVLEMSRIESGKIELKDEVVNLEELMDNLDSIMRGQAEVKSQTLTVTAGGLSHNYIHTDRLRLDQILLNLTSNAVKYTQAGGRIDITAEELDEKAGGAVYRFRVKDNGMGMSEEFASKVFEAFERDKEAEDLGIQGTGLGMAITKRIVDLMDGEIRVDTKLDEGTVFTMEVWFRFANEKEIKNYGKTLFDPSGVSFEGKRVLLADDVEINREIAVAVLEMMDLKVETACDGMETVEKVLSHPAGFYDAVLLDIQMPKMNGYEAAMAIREISDQEKASVPLIAMTANAFDEDIRNAFESGMNGHVAKPIDREKLAHELALAFSRGKG